MSYTSLGDSLEPPLEREHDADCPLAEDRCELCGRPQHGRFGCTPRELDCRCDEIERGRYEQALERYGRI